MAKQEKKEKKAKRRPSGYNLFIKKCMIANKEQMKGKPFGAAAPVMKGCSEAWKKLSEAEKEKIRAQALQCTPPDIPGRKWVCPID